MDGIPTPAQPTAQVVKNSFFQTTLGKIVLGISLVIILLIILFSLKYFNIFPFSQNKPSPTPQASLQSIKPESPLENIARLALKKTLPLSLKAEFLPSFPKLNLRQDPTRKVDFTTSWVTSEGQIEAKFSLSADTADAKLTSLDLSLLKTLEPSLELAQTITSQLFTVPSQGTWNCKSLNQTTSCENFWQQGEVKRGIGISNSAIFFCERDPQAAKYGWKSCIVE